MSDDVHREVLLVLYSEVNEHLRATDDKRDRLLNIYISLVIAVISGALLLKFEIGNAIDTPLRITLLALSMAIIAFSESVYFAAIGARKWHAEYMNCLIIIQRMLSTNTFEIGSKLVPDSRRQPFLPGRFTNRALMLIQLTNSCVLLSLFNLVCNYNHILTRLSIVIGIAVVIVSLNHILGRRLLRKAQSSFWNDPGGTWCFAGLVFNDKMVR